MKKKLFGLVSGAVVLFASVLLLSESTAANVKNYGLKIAQEAATKTTPETEVLITEVVVKGVEGKLKDLVYKTIKTKPSIKITRSDLQKDINAVFNTGFFSNVKAIPEDIPQGVRVTFEVKPNSILRQVKVTVPKGNAVIPQKIVNDIFTTQYGNILNLIKLQAGIKQLNKWYQDNGYIVANVIGKPKVSDDGIVTLEVVEGVIKDIQVRFLTDDKKDKDENGKPITGEIPKTTILNQIELKPGDIFYRPRVQQDLNKLLRLGVFKDIEMTFTPTKDKRQGIAILNVVENELASEADLLIEYYKELETAQVNKKPIEQVKALKKIAIIFAKEESSYEKGVEKYQQALKILEKNPNEIELAKVYNLLGKIYAKNDKYSEGIPYYEKALKIYQSKQDKLGETILLNNLGNTYLQSLKYEKAIELLSKAQENFAELNQPLFQAFTLNNIALSHRFLNEKDKALDFHQKALNTIQTIKENPKDVQRRLNKCENRKESGKTTDLIAGWGVSTSDSVYGYAMLNFDDRLTNCLPNNAIWKFILLSNLAGIYQTTGDYQQSLYAYNNVLSLSEVLKKDKSFISFLSLDKSNTELVDKIIQAFSSLYLSDIYVEIDKKDLSKQYKKQYYDLLKEEVPKFFRLWEENSSQDAFIVLKPFLTFVFESLVEEKESNAESNIFFYNIVKDLLEYNLKETNIKDKEVKVFIEEVIFYFKATSLVSEADKLTEDGKNQQAIEFYNKALKDLNSINPNLFCINNLRYIYNKFKSNKSKDNLEKYLDNIDNNICLIKINQDKAKALNSKAKTYLAGNDSNQALSLLKQALVLTQELAQKPIPPEYKENNNKLNQAIQTLSNKKNNEQSIQDIVTYFINNWYNSQIKNEKKIYAESLYLFGKTYTASKQYDKAATSFNRALKFWNETESILSKADNYLGIAINEREQGNFTKAEKEIEKAIEIIESTQAQVAKQKEESSNDDDDDDFPKLKPKSTVFKSYIDLAKYLEPKQNYYSFYIDLLMEMHEKQPQAGYNILAFQASERSKGKGLRAIINRGNINQGDVNATDDSKYSSIQLEKIPSLSEIQQQVLDEDTMLLEYSLGKEHSYLFAVTKNSIKTYKLPKEDEIQKLSRQFLQNLQSPAYRLSRGRGIDVDYDGSNIERVENKLSEILLAPVASDLSKKRLLIVSNGALQYLPFAALPKPTTDKDKNTIPLLVDHEIVGLPSASLQLSLKRYRKQQKPTKSLFLFADPVFSFDDKRISLKNKAQSKDIIDATPLYKRLPGTLQEATQIAALVSANNKEVKLGFDASYKNLVSPELNQYRYVHLATHGILDAENPEKSGIILSAVDSQGNLERGLLSAPNTFKLDMSADLVVLSGCVTALGKEIKGEGMIGLTGGLMYAGSKSVISSLWYVDDNGTAQLMSKLYSKMLKQGLSPAAALRAAQLEMWRSQDWQAPYFWAAFTIQGDAKDNN